MTSSPRKVMLLVGKTGHGKSATGNSITGMEEFKESDNFSSCTVETKRVAVHRFDYIVTVVDGPGLMDTKLSRAEDFKTFGHKWGRAVTDCSEGIDAFLLVLKYSEKYTEEIKATVSVVKTFLGENVFRDFGIIVFTFGELFDMQHGKRKTLEDWLKEQKTDMADLLKEFSHRAIMFRNNPAHRSDDQVENLLQMVNDLRSGRYTSEIFQEVQKLRKKMEVEKQAPELRASIQFKIDLLISGIEKVSRMQSLDSNARRDLQNLRSDVESLDKEISELDQETGVLEVLQKRAKELKKELDRTEELLAHNDSMHRKLQEQMEAQMRKDRLAEEAKLTEELQAVKKNLQETQAQLKETNAKVDKNLQYGLVDFVNDWIVNPIKGWLGW